MTELTKLLYIGGVNAAERGAIGTHTAGMLRALNQSCLVELEAVFLGFARPVFAPSRTIYFGAGRPRRALGKIVLLIRYAFFIRALLLRKQFDYVYIRFDPFHALALRLILPTVRFVVEYNDVVMDQIRFVLEQGGWSRLGRLIRRSGAYSLGVRLSERLLFSPPNHVIAVTDRLLEYCRAVCPRLAGQVVLNATDAFLLSEQLSEPEQPDTLRLGHIGTLTYWDGLEELVRAVAALKVRAPHKRVCVRIVGEGALRPSLERLVAELDLASEIEMHPATDAVSARMELATVDVVPLLKTIEGYGLSPIKFYEALGMGCTVLVSDIEHMNSIPKWVGSVVSFPLQIDEISNELERLWGDRVEIRKRKTEIAEYAKQSHSWNARVGDLLQALATARTIG